MDSGSAGTGTPARAIAGLAALQDLSVLLEGVEDPRLQRPICRQVLEARRKLLGPDHPTTIEVEARLAAIAMELEEYQGARDAYTVLLERSERVFGPRNLDTLSAVHGLAIALSYMEESQLARPLYERVYSGRRNSLGAEDPATLSALHNLGLTYRALGDNAAARATFEQLDKAKLPLMAERYAQLAEKPGAELRRPLPPVRLEVDPVNTARTTARLDLDRSRPVAAFCPGAEYGPAKRWPARHFAALARELAQRGYAVWLIGSGKDAELGEEIRAQSGGVCENLCGKTDLAAAIDLMSCAKLVVSNDSGLMHVAAALGKPLVALYGSSSPAHTPPVSLSSQPALARIVKIDIACSPCFARECPLGHFKCMNDLLPAQVLAEIDAVGVPTGAG